jgi:signal transduction histidine kinase
MNPVMGSSAERAGWEPIILAGVGVGLLVVTAGELLFRAAGDSTLTGAVLVGVASNVPVQCGLVFGAHRLRQSTVAPQYHGRILRWSFAGAGLFGVLIGMFAPLIFETWLDQVATVRWAVSIGAGSGFVAGYVTARLTEQRVAAERASIRAEEARERQELLEYLNALLRHEILNATSAVHGRAAMLESEYDDPESKGQLETIKRQSESMADIVTDVQVLLQASQGIDTAQQMDVTPIIEAELRRLDDRQEEIATHADLPEAAVVEANDLLPRVFENLIRNAVEHNDSTPIRVTVTAEKRADDVTVSVTDNGPGIPENVRADIFTPNVRRLDDENRLGTVIVGRLVEEYDGQIEVTETGSDGTTVTVTLPLASATVPETTGAERQPQSKSASPRS